MMEGVGEDASGQKYQKHKLVSTPDDVSVPVEPPPHVSERLQGGFSPAVREQRKITALILAQLMLVCVVMIVTYASSRTHRDAFNWKGAQIATAVITGWFWFFLLVSARSPCFSWVILFAWSLVMGMTMGFAGVTASSFVPLFFVLVQVVSAAILCTISFCSDYAFYYRLGGAVQLFVSGTAWITWWLVHFEGGGRMAAASLSLCALSMLFSLWTLWVVRRAGSGTQRRAGGEMRRRALLNLYTLNLATLCCYSCGRGDAWDGPYGSNSGDWVLVESSGRKEPSLYVPPKVPAAELDGRDGVTEGDPLEDALGDPTP